MIDGQEVGQCKKFRAGRCQETGAQCRFNGTRDFGAIQRRQKKHAVVLGARLYG
jgi:hypothetical protein